MAQVLPPHVPQSLAVMLRRDGDWLRCAEPNCGDRAFWGIFRDADFLRVKVAAHRAKMHGARPVRPAAGRPQRRAAAEAAVPAAGVLVNEQALAALQVRRLGAGVARVGFSLADVVIKRALRGQERHNLAEWQSYMSAPADMREWLCPPVMCEASGKWLMVRKADSVGGCRDSAVRAVRSALEPHGVFDLHRGNIGMLDGHPVATDYAQGMDGAIIHWRAR